MNLHFPIAATAKNEHIPYTGNNGLYASMQFDEESKGKLLTIALKAGLTFDPEDVHVTVMYSESPSNESVSDVLENSTANTAECIVTGIDHWVGHNGKTYVILRLQSNELARMNAYLAKQGAVATFLPYTPHITLGKFEGPLPEETIELYKALNVQLAADAITLYARDFRVGDLSG